MMTRTIFLIVSAVLASILRCLRHANIVTLHDIVHTKDTLTFVFEYVVSRIRSQKNCVLKSNHLIHRILISAAIRKNMEVME
jgi:hypothetical protein